MSLTITQPEPKPRQKRKSIGTTAYIMPVLERAYENGKKAQADQHGNNLLALQGSAQRPATRLGMPENLPSVPPLGKEVPMGKG